MSDEKTKEPKRGIGAAAEEAILAGKDNKTALEAVMEEFPEARATKASMNWYRNKLRKSGDHPEVKTARELTAIAKKAKSDDPLE